MEREIKLLLHLFGSLGENNLTGSRFLKNHLWCFSRPLETLYGILFHAADLIASGEILEISTIENRIIESMGKPDN